MKLCKQFSIGMLLFTCALPAFAQTKLLDFEGLQDQETVEEFYNGGNGGNGSGPGTNHGVSFSSNALALIDADAGGGGNFGGEPSPDTILFFTSGASTTMEVPAGFNTGFSFFYASSVPATITIYDGPNATGNVLATLNIPATPMGGGADPTGSFGPFVPIGISFSGTARSVDFAGTANQVGFDNLTLGAAVPVGATTCASEGYTGTQLRWCQIICESESSSSTIDTYLRRWINRYHDLPYCAVEDEGEEGEGGGEG